FQQALAFISAPLEFVEACHAKSRKLLEDLQQAGRQIDRLLVQETILHRTITPLRYIQTLFKVEAARLDLHVQQMFLALTDDIGQLQHQVSETFSTQFSSLRAIQGVMARMAGDLRERTETQQRLVTNKKRQIRQALDRLEAELHRNQERDIQLTQISREVHQKVGQLVVVLQAQDIVSQKLAHIISAFRATRGQAAAAHKHGGLSGPAQALNYLRQAGRLESAQLAAIQADLERTHDQLLDVLDQVGAQIRHLDQSCIHLDEFNTITASADGFVQVLLDALAELSELVAMAVASAAQVHDTIRPLGGQAANLTGVMRDLTTRIHLIALNAQVQAVHAGCGSGLEVLAASTATVAHEISGISERISADVDAFGRELDDLVNTWADLREQAAAQQQTLERERGAREEALHAFRDETLKELEHVGRHTERIQKLAAEMRSRVDLKSLAHGLVRESRQALEEFVRQAEGTLDSPEHREAAARFVNDLADRYTMASERAVHHNTLVAATQPTRTLLLSTQAAKAAPAAMLTATPVAAPDDGTLPLHRADSPSSPASVNAPPTDGAGLGDNVELF
ncbi:MAG TPA: hypothetical protein VNO52_11950, partial [Methylomirabilota bacterium]|nr:hypothetical protein [Methylomirabilota bacterium]